MINDNGNNNKTWHDKSVKIHILKKKEYNLTFLQHVRFIVIVKDTRSLGYS